MTVNAGRVNYQMSGSSSILNFNAATDLTVAGNLNTFWVSASKDGGFASIQGDSNTIIFRPSATPLNITVMGSANTIYLPAGSTIPVNGIGAAMTSVKYYKP